MFSNNHLETYLKIAKDANKIGVTCQEDLAKCIFFNQIEKGVLEPPLIGEVHTAQGNLKDLSVSSLLANVHDLLAQCCPPGKCNNVEDNY